MSAVQDLPRLEENRDAYLVYLTECFKENLNHARHIENERYSFLSLFLVSAGLFLGFIVSDETNPWMSLFLSIALLVCSWIMSRLFRRWNEVYEGHMAVAKRLAWIIDHNGQAPESDPLRSSDWEDRTGHHINFYYYFDNTGAQAAPLDHQPPPPKKHWYHCWRLKGYTHTNDLFLRFSHVLTAVEILAAGISVYRVLQEVLCHISF